MKLHRVLKSSMLISMAIVGFSIPAIARGVDAKKIFERPFITGASVSADWNTKSPGKTLALCYTKESEILTVAIGGGPGK
ncbi:MAG: hypothetical protein EOP04_11115 [Proteobacteria bacterium]|nr:MAG: hypothetical protein EOP04_11115 [Pseudomonadota bacterium]